MALYTSSNPPRQILGVAPAVAHYVVAWLAIFSRALANGLVYYLELLMSHALLYIFFVAHLRDRLHALVCAYECGSLGNTRKFYSRNSLLCRIRERFHPRKFPAIRYQT